MSILGVVSLVVLGSWNSQKALEESLQELLKIHAFLGVIWYALWICDVIGAKAQVFICKIKSELYKKEEHVVLQNGIKLCIESKFC